MRPKLFMRGGTGKLVPRADREAVVATVNPVSDGFPKFAGNVSLVLDGQIGNAAPRIEPVGLGKGGRRANIQAVSASAAMVGLTWIGWNFQCRKHLTEKQPRAELPRHQICMLALPAKTGALGHRFFHHRRSVDEQFDVAIPIFGDPASKLTQALFHHVVVVAPTGIGGHRPPVAVGMEKKWVFFGTVIHPNCDDAFSFRPQIRWRLSAFAGRFKPAHIAVIAVREIAFEIARGLTAIRTGKADRIEPQRQRVIADTGAGIAGHNHFTASRCRPALAPRGRQRRTRRAFRSQWQTGCSASNPDNNADYASSAGSVRASPSP